MSDVSVFQVSMKTDLAELPCFAPLVRRGMKACTHMNVMKWLKHALSRQTAITKGLNEQKKGLAVVHAEVSRMLFNAVLALDTRIGPNVFTSNTLLKLSLSSLARAVSADA